MRPLLLIVFWLGFGGGSNWAASSTAVPRSAAIGAHTLPEQLRAAKASGVILDWNSGRVLETAGEGHAATPGSILKPLLLSYALQQHIVSAGTQVYCRRTLHVAGRELPCSHPNDMPLLDAQQALADSCNTWFAEMARRMSPQGITSALQRFGLTQSSSRLSDPDERILTVLGLENVLVTPMQIAVAYRTLLLHETRTSTVWAGLRDSVTSGMAHGAYLPNTDVLGKTGTASNHGEWRTHGWFAGCVPGRYVIVIYVPRGDGGTAATLAAAVLRKELQEAAR